MSYVFKHAAEEWETQTLNDRGTEASGVDASPV